MAPLNIATLRGLSRAALEHSGLGPTIWGERDCFTFVSNALRVLTGEYQDEDVFMAPYWAYQHDERKAIIAARKKCKTVRKFWLWMIEQEPSLTPNEGEILPGMVGLTQSAAYDGLPRVGIIGPELILWTRTTRGIEPAFPIAETWRLPCHS